MFQSGLLILISSLLRRLGFCWLPWKLGETGEAGSDGGTDAPPESKTELSELPHHTQGAHGSVLAGSPPYQHGCAIASGQGFA